MRHGCFPSYSPMVTRPGRIFLFKLRVKMGKLFMVKPLQVNCGFKGSPTYTIQSCKTSCNKNKLVRWMQILPVRNWDPYVEVLTLSSVVQMETNGVQKVQRCKDSNQENRKIQSKWWKDVCIKHLVTEKICHRIEIKFS